MNLVIDQGNTKTKLAVFEDDLLIEMCEVKVLTSEKVDALRSQYSLDKCIFSTVRVADELLLCYLEKAFSLFINLLPTTPIPISLAYKTPLTLGCDRIAAAVGAQGESETKTALIIDVGTAITYDLLMEGRTFLGGNISPGMHLRFKALHEFTGRLPKVEAEGETPRFGDSTVTAIRSGVIRGVEHEIEGYIASVKAEYPDVLLFLTGGDSDFFATKLKCSIFVDKKLVIKGLNRILNYNVRNK